MLSTALQKNWLQFYLFFSTWFTLPIYTFCIQCLDYDRMCTFYYRINRVITIKTHNRTEGDHFMRCQSRNISHHLRFFSFRCCCCCLVAKLDLTSRVRFTHMRVYFFIYYTFSALSHSLQLVSRMAICMAFLLRTSIPERVWILLWNRSDRFVHTINRFTEIDLLWFCK